MVRKIVTLMGLVAAAGLGCDDDDDTMAPPETTTFQVSISNVSTVYDFPASGVFNTPVGVSMPGPIGPGSAYEFSFSAAPGSKLSFATMFVPSNDFFYAPDDDGIALFDASDTPISADVTDQIQLWDAGTEVNQEPGLGPDQPMRQADLNTGADDPDNSVRIAPDDFGNLPAVTDVLQVTVTSSSATEFTVRIENVSDGTTLMTSDMNTQAVPLAPGVFVIHTGANPLFTTGSTEPGDGLEALAEDGIPTDLGASLADRTGLTTPLAPGVWALHTSGAPLFSEGEPDRGDGLEALAEDGDPAPLAMSLADDPDLLDSGAFTTPEGAAAPGVLPPGDSYVFEVTASEGARLSLATMFVQSNDLFYAFSEDGIALFAGGMPISGDITGQIMLWDAGTEVNEEPGVGLNQAPRQGGADVGPEENGNVRLEDDGFTYPAVSDVIQVTITPM